MVGLWITRKYTAAPQAVDPRGIGDLTSLYYVTRGVVPLANRSDLSMALYGQDIDKPWFHFSKWNKNAEIGKFQAWPFCMLING